MASTAATATARSSADPVFLVLGRRSQKLRAEIIKAVSGAPTRVTQELRAKLGCEIELVCELTASLLDALRQELDETLLRRSTRGFKVSVCASATSLATRTGRVSCKRCAPRSRAAAI